MIEKKEREMEMTEEIVIINPTVVLKSNKIVWRVLAKWRDLLRVQ